jgi:hypothetical protein
VPRTDNDFGRRSGTGRSAAQFALKSHIFLLEKTPCFDTSSTHQNWLLNTENFRKPESIAFTVPPNSKSPVSDGEFVCNGQGNSARLPVPMTPCHGLNGWLFWWLWEL